MLGVSHSIDECQPMSSKDYATIKAHPDASSIGPSSDRCCALFAIPSAILPLNFQHELDAQFHSGMEGCSGFFRIHGDGEGVDFIGFLNGQEFQIDADTMNALRRYCTDAVASIGGKYKFEDAVKFQQG